MNHRSILVLVLVIVAGACSAEDRRSPPPAEPAPPALAKATQADLSVELDDADRRGTWIEVRRRWQGQVLRWTVTRQRVLCRTADACNVAAFPIQRPAQAGWLPTLSFAPGQFELLSARCGNKEQCDVVIEGKLEKLSVSGDMPTNLLFTNVRIVDGETRTARG